VKKELENYIYTYEEYMADIKSLTETLRGIKNLHLISVFRGSVPIVIHLSNILDCNMSIMKFYNEINDFKGLRTIQCWMPPIDLMSGYPVISINEGDNLVVIEDVYDSGKTIKSVKRELASFELKFKKHSKKYYSLFGRRNDDDVNYLREINGKWIVFPWESIS
jgi:hypoxanthine phosphoribosyltransferase